jgi:hypothetical protein
MRITFDMRELTKELNNRAIPAEYMMTGGNNGTIYAGRIDRRGFYECVIGASDFSTGQADYADLFYGKDTEESPVLLESIFPVSYGMSVQDLADEIESAFFTYCCGACGLAYPVSDADYAGYHQKNLCEAA